MGSECAVQMVINLLKNQKKESVPYLALLAFRNTPSQGPTWWIYLRGMVRRNHKHLIPLHASSQQQTLEPAPDKAPMSPVGVKPCHPQRLPLSELGLEEQLLSLVDLTCELKKKKQKILLSVILLFNVTHTHMHKLNVIFHLRFDAHSEMLFYSLRW